MEGGGGGKNFGGKKSANDFYNLPSNAVIATKKKKTGTNKMHGKAEKVCLGNKKGYKMKEQHKNT